MVRRMTMNRHFAYLVTDADNQFFGGLAKEAIDRELSLEKRAATVGQMVAGAGRESLKAATKIPRAAVRKPLLRATQKLAADINSELELLKIAGSRLGHFGMTKAAADLLLQLESDPGNPQDELDVVADILVGSALDNDLADARTLLVKEGGLSEQEFVDWSAHMLKTSGIGELLGKIIGKARGFIPGAAKAEGAVAGLARGAKTEAAGLAGLKGVARAPATAVRAGQVANLASHASKALTGAERAMPTLAGRGGQTIVGTPSKVVPAGKSPGAAVSAMGHPTITPPPRSTSWLPPPPPSKVVATTAGAEEAGAAARAGEKATNAAKAEGKELATDHPETSHEEPKGKGGVVNSMNKLFRGEKLTPEERTRLGWTGVGAFAADRYLLHGGKED
jgi:hypothetical protein